MPGAALYPEAVLRMCDSLFDVSAPLRPIAQDVQVMEKAWGRLRAAEFLINDLQRHPLAYAGNCYGSRRLLQARD